MDTCQSFFIGPSPRIRVDSIGSGELLVLLHGIGGNRRNWQANLPALAAHLHVVAWDARGYGDSDDYDGALDFRDFARDLVRVLDHFGAGRAHILGLSMGSWIAMDFAANWPERVGTLTLCATHIGFAQFSDAAKAEFVRSRKEPLLGGAEPADIALPVARSLVSPTASAEALDQLVDSMARLHKESFIKAIEAVVHTDYRDSLPRIAVPTHVICGSDDPLTTPRMAREVADLVPGAELTMIPGAGHLVNIEKPLEFDAAALGFLRRHAGTASAG